MVTVIGLGLHENHATPSPQRARGSSHGATVVPRAVLVPGLVRPRSRTCRVGARWPRPRYRCLSAAGYLPLLRRSPSGLAGPFAGRAAAGVPLLPAPCGLA